MRTVSVVGVGKTPFGALANDNLKSLGAAACRKALEDAGLEPGAVEAFYLGNFAGDAFVGQNHLAPYIASEVGITGVPCTRFEAACASSGSAFFHAWSAVAAGIYDCVLVAGVEKMTSQTTAKGKPGPPATGSHFFSKKYPQGKSGIVTSDPNTLLPTSPAQVAPTVPIYCVRTLALQQVPAAGILFCNCFLPAATEAKPPTGPSSYSASHKYFQKSLVPYFQPLTPCVSPAHHGIRPSLALYFSRNEETAPAHPSSTGPPAPLTVFPLY